MAEIRVENMHKAFSDFVAVRDSHRLGVFVEPRDDELAVERLVRVVQERDEIVDARAEEGVLEVDPTQALGLPDHQVSGLVVPVDESARPARDAVREA